MPASYLDTAKMYRCAHLIEVPFNQWLRGEKAFNTGLMYTLEPKQFDMFGFILKAAGYSEESLIGMRVPSQFAQIAHKSGQYMAGVAKFLTTSGHSDTDMCVTLGKINDDPKIDDDIRQQRIGKLLKEASIGVTFSEKIKQPMSDEEFATFFRQWLDKPSWEVTSSTVSSIFMEELKKLKFAVLYTKVKDHVVYMVYGNRRYSNPNISIIDSGVVNKSNHFMETLISYDWASSNSLWFSGAKNIKLLSAECQNILN